MGGQVFGWQRCKAHIGGLTTSTHSAWQADNTFRGWTPSSSTAPYTVAHKPTRKQAHTDTHKRMKQRNNELLVAGRQNRTMKRRRTSLQPAAPELGNLSLFSYLFYWLDAKLHINTYTHTHVRGLHPSNHHSMEPANHNVIFIAVTMGWYINRLHSPFPPGCQLNVSTLGWERESERGGE